MRDQGLLEAPNRREVGYVFVLFDADKAPERAPIQELIFHLRIGEIVKVLQKEDLDHAQGRQPGASAVSGLCFVDDLDVVDQKGPLDELVDVIEALLDAGLALFGVGHGALVDSRWNIGSGPYEPASCL